MAGRSGHLRETSFLPPGVGVFFRRRLAELAGMALLAAAAVLLLALSSYDPADPSLNNAVDGPVSNLVGRPGAYAADLVVQTLGLAGGLIAVAFAAWGWRLLSHRGLAWPWLRLALLPAGLLLTAVALAILTVPEGWRLPSGAGGFAGTLLLARLVEGVRALGLEVEVWQAAAGAAPLALVAAILALGYSFREWLGLGRGIVWLLAGAGRGLLGLGALAGRAVAGRAGRRRRVPRRAPTLAREGPPFRRPAEVVERAMAARPHPRPPPRQTALDLVPSEDFQLPALDLLDLPERDARALGIDEEALAQNAKLLESVLDDFGVRGDIVRVRPGPVVTLYELEPAPGTKSARVISLADDIARSMSSVSARVAVVPGRNVIGIELPNSRRETVFLRELLADPAYERTASRLALVLGKDISGAPVIVDLARMPHLLIAGTTGSGKSVAINAMILSLLYRLPPDQCKFIMIDPKMLELSVYDGIPHLISPVVTEPRKAIVALKWIVREMENRYRAMSVLGVRNITGYNARVAEARRKGQVLVRRVQTGFDSETGKPVFEEQPLDLEPLPLVVVIVDEMADLMLMAGKEIEASVQRVSQMARAAGIHLIMATQRPSVDVITGTIKANFPTRISFQVTSKIDSRTILGEQGAEQLLGQGDMLYMVAGGRITRVHGPLVRDDEVEAVVKFLKRQGEPSYIEAITEEEENGAFGYGGGGLGGEDELYDQAVALVCRERKASTSFVQRHLQIGYNRAARIIERMEAEGVVGPANHVGKREVLARHVGDARA